MGEAAQLTLFGNSVMDVEVTRHGIVGVVETHQSAGQFSGDAFIGLVGESAEGRVVILGW